MLNFLYQSYVKTASAVMPTLAESRFREEGVLTPAEFVLAGDTLVDRWKTWQWEHGDPDKSVPHLPKDKQFLMARNLKCAARVATLEDITSTKTATISVEGFDWVIPASEGRDDVAEAIEIPAPDSCTATSVTPVPPPEPATSIDEGEDDGEPLDLESVDESLVENDPATLPPAATTTAAAIPIPEAELVSTRTYDISITYDVYYRTPKVWLFGYNEAHKPLKPHEVFQDISGDHAHKTVTMDNHPHLGIQTAFIHPCRHAEVMKKIIQRQIDAGKEARVDQYMVLFLKFISSVIPTIEHDFTMEIEG
ncbi:autophagy protein 3 [Pelomyxa schiedti]|nr:autophagy protein 3 [Pelomyxa schiedti]